MDLIYADKNKIDVGVLDNYSFDLAFGSDENDFEVTVSTNNNVCKEDYILYIEGTEYGGIIDGIQVDTASKEIKYKGRTYHGILNSKVIIPNSGADYLVMSGDANTIIKNIISRISLNEFFKASTVVSGIRLNAYQFPRYVTAYDGLRDMLQSVNAKLHFKFEDGFVVLEALPINEYLDDEIDSDHLSFKIEKTFNPINHMICLGSGELRNRTVVNLYCDENGNVSTTQTFSGIDEITYVYDYPNAESVEQLTSEGTKKLKELNGSDVVELNLDDTYSFDISDVIHANDIITGISVTRRVIKKIVTINKHLFSINYKVGE